LAGLPLRACGLLFVTLAASCAAAPRAEPARGNLFASIRITESAFKGPIRDKQGFFFYLHEEPGVAGPMLEGYEFRNGKQVDEFGGGSESAGVIEAIRKAGLTPFDFKREVEEITARLQREATARGESFIGPQARDGAEWEIVIATESGPFTLRAWNPRGAIDQYAQYSKNIAKLKTVLDLLAQYYGQLKLGPS
jgi:hypothetical protein